MTSFEANSNAQPTIQKVPLRYQSWGNFPSHPQKAVPFKVELTQNPYLMRGLGRSYGDACLSPEILLTQEKQNHFLDFDQSKGVLTCEAGVSLGEIIRWLGPQGWIPAVLPGTQHVTIGGAVANDIHGKNHHRDGSFGRNVKGITLFHKGEPIHCSPNENKDLFEATIGGLGLTGSITEVTLQLAPVSGPFLDSETISLRNLEDFFQASDDGAELFQYSVAWIDSTAKGKNLGQGLFFRANHASKPGSFRMGTSFITVPPIIPNGLLNRHVLNLFNKGYGLKKWLPKTQRQHLKPFFFPLDAINDWNRLYGKNGFVQYQCVTPARSTIERILDSVSRAKQYSFLTVLKKFGNMPSPGIMSFPKPGFTLAMDFVRNQKLTKLMDQWDQWIVEDGGSLYLAKDSRMSATTFASLYPQFRNWSKFWDPNCSSYLKSRLMEPNL